MSESGGAGNRARVGDDDRTNHLRELLQKNLTELNEQAAGKSREIPAEQLAFVERLARLVRLADELKPPPSRWPPALALIVALLCVSLLLLIRVAETEVAVEATVTEMSFTLPAEKPVIGRSGVAQIGVSGLDDLKISPEVIAAFSGARGRASTIRLAGSSNSVSRSAINTATLIPPPGTKVWLSHADAPRGYRLSLKPPGKGTTVVLKVEAQGEVEVAAPDVLERGEKFDLGKSGATFAFESSNDIMDLDFVLHQNSDLQFYAQVPIQNLGLSRIEEFSTPGKSLVNAVSTLLSGALYLESLNGEKRELRAGEQIRFGASNGRIESLKLENDRITFKFRGRVSGMRIGEEGVSQNLMPNLLEWLKARQPLSLLWGTTILLYGLIASVLNWYRKAS